jgi:hypothetical protein
VIRNDLGKQFKARVEHWHRYYHERIKDRPNDSRIATNHACLAAAFESFAGFMSDVWPEADQAARTFAEEYVAGLVVEAAGAVEEQIPARIFLSTLAELIAFGRVRIVGISATYGTEDRDKDKIIGQMVYSFKSYQQNFHQIPDEEVIVLSIPLALKAVQEQLRGQGRELLQVSVRTLLDQLAAMGVLVDPNNVDCQIVKNSTGEKTKKVRIGGKSVNAASIKVKAFPRDRSSLAAAPSPATGTIGIPATLPFAPSITAS